MTNTPLDDVAGQSDNERERARDLLDEIQRDHDPARFGESGQIAAESAEPGSRTRSSPKTRSAPVPYPSRGGRWVARHLEPTMTSWRTGRKERWSRSAPDTGRASTCIVSRDLGVNRSHQDFQRGLALGRGKRKAARDHSSAKTKSSAMMTQATITISVMGTGPSWNSGAASRGEWVIANLSKRRSSCCRARRKPSAPARSATAPSPCQYRQSRRSPTPDGQVAGAARLARTLRQQQARIPPER